MIQKKILSLLMVFVMIFGTMGGSFAAYYDEYPAATKVSLSNLVRTNNGYYGNYKKNLIRFTLNFKSIEKYSFNNEDWYLTGGASNETFFIREDFYDQTDISGVEVVMPKSVNVMFIYVKEYYSSQVKVFSYKLSELELNHIYAGHAVPQSIINVTDAIDELPSVSDLMLSDIPKLKIASDSFNALGDDGKRWVFNAHKLYDLEARVDELKAASIDWTQIYKDLDNANAGKLTEQYYAVPNVLYADLYKPADKAKIYEKKIGDQPKYTLANITVDKIKDTTPSADNTFFTYRYNNVPGQIWSAAMAKKVWGYFTPVKDGDYKFKITSDDGHDWVMYLDDGKNLQDDAFNILDETTTIASAFNLHDISDYETGKFILEANRPYPLFIEYYNHGGNAALKLQYCITDASGRTGAWTDMKGDVFKPSTAYEFGFRPGNSSELLNQIEIAKPLTNPLTGPKVGVLEGQVSQIALTELTNELVKAISVLDKAVKNTLTQTQINTAAEALKLAIAKFKSAVVLKPNAVSAPFIAQNGNNLLVEFNKDLAVNTYEIVVSPDNIISSTDTVYKVTNALYKLDGASTLNVVEGNLKGKLDKKDGATNGKYSFDIPLGDLQSASSISVFLRAATGENKGDAIESSIALLKQPTEFKYSINKNNGAVTFYTGEAADKTGFAIEYYVPGVAQPTRTYLVQKGSDNHTVDKANIDLAKIAQATLYRIKTLDGPQENFIGGHSAGLTNPVLNVIPSVEGLESTIVEGHYKLNWKAFVGATGYEVYVGDTDVISDMIKIDGVQTLTSLELNTQNILSKKYYAVKAVVPTQWYKQSGFSNVVSAQFIVPDVNVPTIPGDGNTSIDKDGIKTVKDADFEITYSITINSENVFNPNYMFDLNGNKYFGYDYPTISVVDGKNRTPIKFHTAVAKDSNDNNKIKVNVLLDDASNYAKKEVLVTLKIKPTLTKPIVGDDDNLMSLAKDAGLLDKKTEQNWELDYVIANIKDKSNVSVMNGLGIVSSYEFKTILNSSDAKDVIKSKVETLKLQFKNKEKYKQSY